MEIEQKNEVPGFKWPSALKTTLIGFALLIGFSLVAGAIIYFLADIFDLTILGNGFDMTDNDATLRNQVRTIVLVQHLFTFIIPSFLLAWVLVKGDWKQFLSINIKPKQQNIFIGILMFFCVFPLVQYLYYLNQQIPLPEMLSSMEESTNEMIEQLLETDTVLELFFNLFIIAIIPGMGEELLFRGIFQKTLERTMNWLPAIIISAIVFSAIHMQFEGFIARFALGFILGYIFGKTGNLWISIFAHVFYNGFQVLMQYMYSQSLSPINIDEMDSVPWWSAVLSLGLIIFLSKFLIPKNTDNG